MAFSNRCHWHYFILWQNTLHSCIACGTGVYCILVVDSFMDKATLAV